ncbi:MAG: MFS transporter [Pusillimonas sp.]
MSDQTPEFSLRKIAVAAFGPSILFGIGEGAIYPVIALTARELGASLALAGLIVALLGIGSLLNNIPAALATARWGERRAMVGAAILSAIGLLACLFAPHVAALAVGVLVIGMANSVFLLARQTYLTEAVPISMRARALSTLGGTTRIGLFIGPFAGAGLMHFAGLSGAYIIALCAMLGAGALAFFIPDLVAKPSTTTASAGTANPAKEPSPTMVSIARAHAKTYMTLGLGCVLVMAIRSCRQVVIPLWAVHIGIDATTTALVYGLMGAVDMLLFYPAGKLMDQKGRLSIALPSMLVMGSMLLLMPFTESLTTFVIVSMVLGFGNGIGSGLIMTIGADASPARGRRHFLGLWRLLSDIGGSGGPLLLSGLTALVSLGAGIATIGGLGFAAAWVFWRWLPRPTDYQTH